MKEQLEIEELSQVIEHEREDRIKQLEEALESATKEVKSNSAAAEILTKMVEAGECK